MCIRDSPKGECHLAQGNYRAEVRIRTLRRLLAEIGLEPGRAELLNCSGEDSPHELGQLIRGAVERICALGESPLRAAR